MAWTEVTLTHAYRHAMACLSLLYSNLLTHRIGLRTCISLLDDQYTKTLTLQRYVSIHVIIIRVDMYSMQPDSDRKMHAILIMMNIPAIAEHLLQSEILRNHRKSHKVNGSITSIRVTKSAVYTRVSPWCWGRLRTGSEFLWRTKWMNKNEFKFEIYAVWYTDWTNQFSSF